MRDREDRPIEGRFRGPPDPSSVALGDDGPRMSLGFDAVSITTTVGEAQAIEEDVFETLESAREDYFDADTVLLDAERYAELAAYCQHRSDTAPGGYQHGDRAMYEGVEIVAVESADGDLCEAVTNNEHKAYRAMTDGGEE